MAETSRPVCLVPALAADNHTSKRSRFTIDLLSFTGANVLYLVVTAITTFLIPRVLSVEAFGVYRLFLLYASYVGILHFGYLDGALVSWAAVGKQQTRNELPTAIVIVATILLIASTGSVCLWSVVSSAPWRWMILPITIYAVIANLTTVYLYALQAEKRFKQLSLLTLLQPSLLLISVVALAFDHNTAPRSLLAVYLGSSAISLLIAARSTTAGTEWNWPSWSKIVTSSRIYLRGGCMILLANLGTNLLLGADRIVISSRFSIQDFAIYSFAATFFYSAFFVVLSTAKVFFPYLSTDVAGLRINKIYGLAERLVFVLWTLGLGAYFPIAWLTHSLLPNYTASLPIVRILLLATGAAALTQLLHSNFFRVMRRPGGLLLVGAISTITTFVALIYTQRFGSLTLIAWTTVASVLAWWILGDLVISVTIGRSRSRTLITLLLMSLSGGTFLICSRNAAPINAVIYLAFIAPIAVLLLGRSIPSIRNLRGSSVATSLPEVAPLP